MKGFMLLAILGILGALVAAGFFMLGRPGARKEAMAKALAVRVALSLLLFFALIGAYHLGWINPHPLRLMPA